MDLITRGLYRTPVSKVVSFDEIPEALRDVAERRVMGRIVARIGDGGARNESGATRAQPQTAEEENAGA